MDCEEEGEQMDENWGRTELTTADRRVTIAANGEL